MPQPIISVIIPVYNHEQYITQTIKSVLDQTHTDFELIIINDGSTDNSEQIIKTFHDPRIVYRFQKNKGAHATINKGIQLAKGKYIAILNSDDFYHPQRFEQLLFAFKEKPSLVAAFSWVQIVNQQGQPQWVMSGSQNNWKKRSKVKDLLPDNDLLLDFLTGNFLVSTSNIFCRAKVFKEMGSFADLRYTHDTHFFLRLLTRYRNKVHMEPQALLSYRQHNANTLSESQAQYSYEAGIVLADYFLNNDLNTIFGKKITMTHLLDVATQLFKSLNTRGSEKLLTTSLIAGMHLQRSDNTQYDFLSVFSDFNSSLCLDYKDYVFSQGLPETTYERHAQLYMDNGKGFNEQDTIVSRIKQDTTTISFDLSSFTAVQRLRLDPYSDKCVIEISDMQIRSQTGKHLGNTYIRPLNAIAKHGNLYIFDDTDPQLEIILKQSTSIASVSYNMKIHAQGDLVYKWLYEDLHGYLPKIKARFANHVGQVKLLGNQEQFKHIITHPRRLLKAMLPSKAKQAKEQMQNIASKSKLTKNTIHLARKYKNRNQDSLISIIMPTYNRASVMQRAINSVLNQSYQHFELLIIDDGSTDNTQAIIEELSLHHASIQYHAIEHAGVSKARNTGLQLAKGDYIAYLDTDNTWHPDYLLIMCNQLNDHEQYKSAYCGLILHDHISNREFVRLRDFNWQKMIAGNYIDLNIFMHTHSLYDTYAGFDESMRRLVDWELIAKYTQHDSPLVVPCILADYYLEKDLDHITTTEDFQLHKDIISARYG